MALAHRRLRLSSIVHWVGQFHGVKCQAALLFLKKEMKAKCFPESALRAFADDRVSDALNLWRHLTIGAASRQQSASFGRRGFQTGSRRHRLDSTSLEASFELRSCRTKNFLLVDACAWGGWLSIKSDTGSTRLSQFRVQTFVCSGYVRWYWQHHPEVAMAT